MRTLLISRQGTPIAHSDPSVLNDALDDPHNLIWLDLQDPTDEDVALLRTQFKFHPLAIEDATRSHERPKVDAYGPPTGAARESYYFIVFYAARYDAIEDHITTQAINLFIGANYLVTVHTGELAEIRDTMTRWKTPGGPIDGQTGALVHAMLDALVDEYFPLMDQVADRVEDLEDTIFIQFDEKSIQTIFGLKKDLLTLRRVVAPERDVLNVLLRRQMPIFKNEEIAYLQDVYDHIVRVTDNVDTYRDLLSSALDSYLSLQSNNLNQVMKLLTMASIVLMTDALIAGVYGMNFRYMPELGWRIGHGWAIIMMVVVTAGLIFYFRRKKWLQ